MDYTFEGGTSTQRQWFKDALALSDFPFSLFDPGTLLVIWVDEPSMPGHKDYMCTHDGGMPGGDDYDFTIEIRNNSTDADAYPNVPGPIKNFYMESVIHEIGHLFYFAFYNGSDDKETLAGMLEYSTLGDGARRGVEVDYNPTDKPWGDRGQEGLAEFFKDVYLPEQYRVYDNRSNWRFVKAEFGAWLTLVEAVICPGG